MSLKETFGKVVLCGAVALGTLGIGVGIYKANDVLHPVSQGEEYLAKKGYTNIEGGATDFFNTCGKNVYARHYSATDPKTGVTEEHTVCFNPLLGPHRPLFGK